MNPPCPFLPSASNKLRASYARSFKTESLQRHYLACLEAAQSLWIQQLPGQSILQLNKALASETHTAYPLPYQALCWILENQKNKGFLGNPVRHFQHLASRISPKVGANHEIRRWRAWACMHLAEIRLEPDQFPRDYEQIENDSLVIPNKSEIYQALKESPWQLEAGEFSRLARVVS